MRSERSGDFIELTASHWILRTISRGVARGAIRPMMLGTLNPGIVLGHDPRDALAVQAALAHCTLRAALDLGDYPVDAIHTDGTRCVARGTGGRDPCVVVFEREFRAGA